MGYDCEEIASQFIGVKQGPLWKYVINIKLYNYLIL